MSKFSNMKSGLRAVLATAVLAAALVAPTQAMAENCSNSSSDPTAAQYCSVSGVTGKGNGPKQVDHGVKGAQDSGNSTPSTVQAVPTAEAVGATAVETSSSSSLPFTGLDVGILAVVAAALTGTGLVLRRLTSTGVPRS